MAPITKLTRKTNTFLWTKECQRAWELIKQKYIETQILISPNWQVEFHVHTNACLLVVGAMLSQNITRKNDQPIVYAFKLINKIKNNYSTTERMALAMVFFLHKFRHYLLGNMFVFYVDHMALVYLVNKPQVSGKITRRLLLFFKYDFTVMYKQGKTHVVADVLSKLLNNIEPIGVPNQTIDASLFYTWRRWLNDVKEFLKVGHIEGMLSV